MSFKIKNENFVLINNIKIAEPLFSDKRLMINEL